MKSKITRGNGFGGVIKYIFDLDKKEGKASEFISSNMHSVGDLSAKNMSQLAKEFREPEIVHNKKLEKPVYHVSLNLPPPEKLSTEKWAEVIEAYLQEMGIDPKNHQYIAARHNDQPHDHIHLVINRLGMDGKVFYGQNDVHKSIKVCQDLEKRFGLTLTKGYQGKAAVKSIKKTTIEKHIRQGTTPPDLKLAVTLKRIMDGKPSTIGSFLKQVEDSGLYVKTTASKDGKCCGFSFSTDEKTWIKGSSVGKAFSFNTIIKTASYDVQRDHAAITARLYRDDVELKPPKIYKPAQTMRADYRANAKRFIRTVSKRTNVKSKNSFKPIRAMKPFTSHASAGRRGFLFADWSGVKLTEAEQIEKQTMEELFAAAKAEQDRITQKLFAEFLQIISAIGAPHYHVHIKNGDKLTTHQFEDMNSTFEKLKKIALSGQLNTSPVYISPVDENQNFLVLKKSITDKNNIKPALVFSTPNNKYSFVRFKKNQKNKNEQKSINKITSSLNRNEAADDPFVNNLLLVLPFFTDKAQIDEAAGVEDKRIPHIMDKMEERKAAQKSEANKFVEQKKKQIADEEEKQKSSAINITLKISSGKNQKKNTHPKPPWENSTGWGSKQ